MTKIVQLGTRKEGGQRFHLNYFSPSFLYIISMDGARWTRH